MKKLTLEQKQERAEVREEKNRMVRIEAKKNQKPVKLITISIEWKKSRIWGANPHASAFVRYQDGTGDTFTATCSGCGYDKESTVVGEIFDQVLAYKLYQVEENDKKAPYGVTFSKYGHYFGKGVGMSCYGSIAEYIGGKMKRVASGKTFDVWEYSE